MFTGCENVNAWGLYFLENVWLSERDFLWSILSFSVECGKDFSGLLGQRNWN